MDTHILKNFKILIPLSLLMPFSACSTLGSSDSSELEILVIDQIFETSDSVTIQFTNQYSHDIFVHRQSFLSLQQYINNEWKVIYTPIADTGPARFSIFIKAGEVKVFNYPALPSSALYEPGHNEFRFTFGLFHEPDISLPLPEGQRTTSSFIVAID